MKKFIFASILVAFVALTSCSNSTDKETPESIDSTEYLDPADSIHEDAVVDSTAVEEVNADLIPSIIPAIDEV